MPGSKCPTRGTASTGTNGGGDGKPVQPGRRGEWRGALHSVNKHGWRCLDAVPCGICSFSDFPWAIDRKGQNYKSRLPQRDEPGHVAGGRPGVRAAVDPVLQ
ncbi:hypothetical protein TREES_T100004987 [Tupaia chinensis]|uniref:Uncharacterized protein n=1 Tax=Tupaia chinensis TaxID=246437 RepID=L9L862_TUPCH|nr:hypothetical protein TREES_T100004987 [Tupaia chinensis]